MAATPVLIGFGVVAIGDRLVLAPVDVGLLFLLGMMGLTAYAAMLGAWASHNRFSLLGGMRAAAQMLAYEVFLGLSVMGVVMIAGSLSMTDIVEAQRGVWFVVLQPLGAALFTIAGVAAAHRLPFDLPESENDLVAGFITEYTGMSFGLFFLGEYLAVLLVSALAVTLFFGGWTGPWAPLGPLWFLIKVFIVLFVFIWMRAALPRLRYDRLMGLGWKYLIEIAVLWVIVTAALQVGSDQGWNLPLTAIVSVAIAGGAYGLLYLSMPRPGEQLEEIR